MSDKLQFIVEFRGQALSNNQAALMWYRGFAASLAVSLWLTGNLSLEWEAAPLPIATSFSEAKLEGPTKKIRHSLKPKELADKPEAYRKGCGKAARLALNKRCLQFVDHSAEAS
jgi:hypothetical protein